MADTSAACNQDDRLTSRGAGVFRVAARTLRSGPCSVHDVGHPFPGHVEFASHGGASVRTQVGGMIEMTETFEIFLSYSRRDNMVSDDAPPETKGWVMALRDHILADHRRFNTEPLRIFFDADDIRDMDDWRHRILGGLRSSKFLLVCLSPNYFRSDYCRWEWEEKQLTCLVGRRGEAPLVPPYILPSFKQALALPLPG
ncbi:MAG: toll/interleukin-1 receptor domain-containing protein [Planctomycetota bacterium]